MSYEPTKVGSLKEGRYVIDPDSGEICRIISIEKSKPGKHGSAKARIEMVGLFDGQKRQLISPVDKRVNVPIIEKRTAQVTNIHADGTIQLMDSETYEMFDAPAPPEQEVVNKINDLFNAGKTVEVEYWKVMNRIKIVNAREMEL